MFTQSEVKQLTAENEELKSTMKVEKEKLHALEAAMEELHRRGRCNHYLPFASHLCTVFLSHFCVISGIQTACSVDRNCSSDVCVCVALVIQ